jgi:hypothetical protein
MAWVKAFSCEESFDWGKQHYMKNKTGEENNADQKIGVY